jgi:acetaldehyde dehydrogenase/alcohol dehydrogenase
MKQIHMKTQVVYGEGSLDVLDTLKHKLVCITTDQQMIGLGLIHKVTERLERAGIRYRIFSEVIPDPTTDQVHSGLIHIVETKPDCLIALGGGSTLDTAKAVMYACVAMKKKLIQSDKVDKPYFIAIPTTSGTGSEVSSYAVVTDSASGVKVPMKSDLMLPDMAILDPELTRSIPPRITAETAMDALTHAMEAWVSLDANPFSNGFAQETVQLIYENLPAAFKDGNDLEARNRLHIASCMAGFAFNSAGLGLNHSLAHAIGGRFHLPHGRLNAIFLPHVIRFNLKDCTAMQKYNRLAASLGFRGAEPEAGANLLACSVEEMNAQLGLPTSLSGAGISREQVRECLPELVNLVIKDICTATNPRQVSPGEVEKLILELLEVQGEIAARC